VDFALNPIDGARIAYRSTGAGPPIVLVHGSALSQVIWRGFGYLRDLGADHTVITLDLRGHGRSDKPTEESRYGMDLLAADVLAVLDALGVESAHYLGYSLGGRVGFCLADARPERITTLISVAGAPGNRPGAFDRLFFPSCIETIESGGMTAFLDEWQAHSGEALDQATRAAFAANDGPALAAYMRRSERDTGVSQARLAALTLPVLPGPRTRTCFATRTRCP
jgi:pimeloyl-ACP methyl ester carboxylesterase